VHLTIRVGQQFFRRGFLHLRGIERGDVAGAIRQAEQRPVSATTAGTAVRVRPFACGVDHRRGDQILRTNLPVSLD
jgi:hypothetical protein